MTKLTFIHNSREMSMERVFGALRHAAIDKSTANAAREILGFMMRR